MDCAICNKKCKSFSSLSSHIAKAHKDYTTESYYIKFINDKDGYCNNPDCSNKVRFISIRYGYNSNSNPNKYCSISCARKSEEVQQKYNETAISNNGSIEEFNKNRLSKMQATSLKNWNHVNPSSSEIIKSKRTETIIAKYDVHNIFQSSDIKQVIKECHEKSGKWLRDEDSRKSYLIYRKIVVKYTNKVKSELFKSWTGYDYYDNEYIKDNINLHFNDSEYPTIDHKISVRYGFENDIDFKIIADISNLCITKRFINNSKNYLTEQEYLDNNLLKIL